MDKIYPASTCFNLPNCKNPTNGAVWVSSGFIRNKTQPSPVTEAWDQGYSYAEANNTPATILYVRIGPSQIHKGRTAFYINGYESPRIFFQKGKKYQFNVSTCGYSFDIGKGVISDYTVFGAVFNEPGTGKYYCPNDTSMQGEYIVV